MFDPDQIDSSYLESNVQGPSAFMGALTTSGSSELEPVQGTERNYSF